MAEREQLIQEFLNGKSVIDIAEQYNMSREAVYQHLRTIPNWKKVSESLKKTKRERALEKYGHLMQEIIRLKEEGLSTIAVARKLDIPYPPLVELLKGTRHDNSKEAREERNKKIYESYKNGRSQRELAIEFGMSQSSISNIVRQWALKETSN
jgi:Mor family transcriptional regulator